MGIEETLQLIQRPFQSDDASYCQSRDSQLLIIVVQRQLALGDECFGIKNNLL